MKLMRSILLAMAGSTKCRRALTALPVTRRVVSRFVPGESLDAALDAAAEVNAAGMTATLNPLGENVASVSQATVATNAYIEILDRITEAQLNCNVSVKLTQLGLDLGVDVARDNLARILEAAQRCDSFVRVDMESSAYVDATLEIWRQLRASNNHLGLVIQSYLRRSAADVDALVSVRAPLRLVKGAYNEPAHVAFADKSAVDRCYTELLDRLADDDARDVAVAVASHDPLMVQHARALIQEHQLDGWEFQMLYGIGKPLQRQLVADGYSVRIYISYGPSWYPWFMRRLAERPANLLFFLRHLFG